MAFTQRFLLALLRYGCCYGCSLLLFFTPSQAQSQGNTIWDAPSKAKQSVSKQSGKTTNTIKCWKKQLEQWGMDSSYHHALFIGGRLYSNGWGGEISYQKPVGDDYDRRKGKHAGQSQFYRLGFSEIKHEKEIKQQGENKNFPELGNTTPFIFGKINNLYTLQLGYGREQLLLPGILEGNISLGFRYSAGVSLAMLKPYYLRLLYVEYTPQERVWLQEERYTESNKDAFLSRDRVLGASKWGKGLKQLDYVPGGYLEGAFTIEPAKGKSFIQLVTIGGQLSAYTQNLRILADQKAYPFMGAFFVGLGLGKRW
jgi:hypothetical protein